MPTETTVTPYYYNKRPHRGQMLFDGAMPDLKTRIALGTPGSGKSTAALNTLLRWTHALPGSTWGLFRWTTLEAVGILRADLIRETPPGLLGAWDSESGLQQFVNGSRVWIHGLKPQDSTSPFGRFAGYSLDGLVVSEIGNVPNEWIVKLRERLRGPLGPWLTILEGGLDLPMTHPVVAMVAGAEKLAERVWKSGDRLIVSMNLEDNQANLPEVFLRDMRESFPPSHPLHPQKVSGTGFSAPVLGLPVYGPDVFLPDRHLADVEAIPTLPLLEAWDFGLLSPAIVWGQYWSGGRLRILGVYQGDTTPLADVIAERKRLLHLWFPQHAKGRNIRTTGDPSGENRKDVGLSSAAVLRAAGIGFHAKRSANSPAARLWAIGHIQGLMGRRVPKLGECFGIHPRCALLIEALQRGYVRDAKRSDAMPLKDGTFDHVANALEYLVEGFAATDSVVRPDGTVDVKQMLREDREEGEPKNAPESSGGWFATAKRKNLGGF